MRRGLISWSRDELPVEVLEARVKRLQEAMRAQGLDVVLAYTSFARPAAVTWLTQFVPYWNEGMLVIPQRGGPVLLAAFSKRVQEWIRDVSYLEDVMTAPNLGKGVLELLKKRIPDFAARGAKVGVIEKDELPWPIAEPLIGTLGDGSLIDAGALFAGIRQPADAAEIGLAERALGLALKALDAVPAGARRASQALAAIDARARCDGAEEVLFRVATDLRFNPVLQRIETDADLGALWALQLSLAYKGVWVRSTRCFANGQLPGSWRGAESWFTKAALRLSDTTPDADALGAPGKVAFWMLESCLGSQPLAVVTHGPARTQQAMPVPARSLPCDALAVLSAELELPEGGWHASAPLVLGANDRATRLLAAA